MPSIYDAISSDRALIYPDLKLQYQESAKQVCRNLGKATSAPATIQMGDGVTSTTYPAQRYPNALAFGTNDYVDTLLLNPFSRTSPFTISALLHCNAPNASAIVSSFDSVGNVGIESQFMYGATNRVYLGIYGGVGTYLEVWGLADMIKTQGLHFIATTYDGTGVAAGVQFYADGVNLAKTIVSDTLGITEPVSANTLRVGMRPGGAIPLSATSAKLFGLGVYPAELTQLQILELERRMRQYLRIV
jgi:hypothetical protein